MSGIMLVGFAIATWNPWRLVVLDTTENATFWAGVLGVVVFVLSAVIRQRDLPPWAQVVLTLGGIFGGALCVAAFFLVSPYYSPPEQLREPERVIDVPKSELTLRWRRHFWGSDACVFVDLQRGRGLTATHRYVDCMWDGTLRPLDRSEVQIDWEPYLDFTGVCRYEAARGDLRPIPGSHPDCAFDWSN